MAWIFVVEDDDTIKRFPFAKYGRLLHPDGNEIIPEYAGRRMRFVEAIVGYENRKPIAIYRLLYLVIPFDAEGRLDAEERSLHNRLQNEIICGRHRDGSKNGINAGSDFASEQFQRLYRWEPTPELEKAVIDMIVGENRRFRYILL